MSETSLNRYTPVPPISPTQPLDESKMSSKKETRPDQSSDLNISGGAAVFSKPPITKRQSSVTAKTAADSREKKVCYVDAKANCAHAETQSNGEAGKEVTSTDATERELVQSQEGNAVTTKDEDASLTVNEEAATDAAVDHSDHDDYDDDDQHHYFSVSFILPVYYGMYIP